MDENNEVAKEEINKEMDIVSNKGKNTRAMESHTVSTKLSFKCSDDEENVEMESNSKRRLAK